MTFGEVLKYFKDEENLESIAALVDEPAARKAVAAWKGMTIKFKEGIGECPDELSDVEKWRWMWDQVECSEEEFGMISGVRIAEAGPLMSRLKALRLIFPDNTISRRAAEYLQAIMLAQLRSAKPEKSKKSEAKKVTVGN